MAVCHRTGMHACSVVSNSLQPHGLWPTRFLCPWDFPGKNTIMCCHFLLQGIFLTQRLRSLMWLLHWQVGSLSLSHLGSPTELANNLKKKNVASKSKFTSLSLYLPGLVILNCYNSSSAILKSEKAMAPHSSTLAWKIPWTEEPSRLQSMGSLRVGHD